MNPTPSKLTGALARVPILGYVLKVVHDFIKLPVLRADLHNEFLDLAERADRNESGLRKANDTIERIDVRNAALAERVGVLESQVRAIREQFDTLYQRVSDNLAEGIDLRQRLSAVDSDLTTPHLGPAHRDGSAGELRELQARIGAQEETFAEVLRRHGRALAVLQESMAAQYAAAQVPQDVLVGLVDLFKAMQAEMRTRAEGRQGIFECNEPEPSGRPLFEAARSLSPEIRLDLGGGARRWKSCVQVAPAAGAGIDLVADPGELPFLPDSITEIHADRWLENCSAKEGRRLLSHWSGLLRQGGTLHLKVMDLESAARSFANASSSFEELTRAILGGKGTRQNAFSREALERLLQESGLHPVMETRAEDASAVGFEFEIHATKAVRQFLPGRTRSIASA